MFRLAPVFRFAVFGAIACGASPTLRYLAIGAQEVSWLVAGEHPKKDGGVPGWLGVKVGHIKTPPLLAS